jgi:hypothetical protein
LVLADHGRESKRREAVSKRRKGKGRKPSSEGGESKKSRSETE